MQAAVFEGFGCRLVRERGDHLIYDYPGASRPVIIPRYDEVPVRIILNNMRVVGMSREQYFELLGRS